VSHSLNYLKFVFLVFLFTVSCNLLFCQSNKLAIRSVDVVYAKTMSFTLSERGDEYQLKNDVSESFRLMTEAATKHNHYTIDEKFYAPVTKIQATIDTKSISEGNITSSIESRPDAFLSDGIEHTINLETLPVVGSTFSFSYRESFKDASFFPLITIPNVDSLEIFKITIEHPEDVRVTFNFFFPFDSIPCSMRTIDEENIELTVSAIGRQQELNHYAYHSTRALVLITMWHNNTQINPTGIREFISWYKIKTALFPKLDSIHTAILADSLRTCKMPYEKLKKIYDYVRSTIRYVADERGINAIVPRAPSKVLTQQYGDCKDRAALVCALAREAGVPVFMALIAPVPVPYESMIHPALFNHVICTYTDSATTLFFDPTARYCEFGNLPINDQQTRAFILDSDNPRYEWVKRIDQQPSIDLTVNCKSDSLQYGVATIVLRNDIRWKALHAMKELTADKLKRFLQEEIASHIAQIRLDQFKPVSESSDALILQARADISSFIVSSTGKQYVPKVPFVTINGDVLERKSDHYPVWIGEPLILRCRIVLQAHGWSTVADTFQILSPSNRDSYQAFSSQQGNNIIFDYAYTQIDRMYEDSSREAFFSFYADFMKQRKSMFIISRK
jgi:hypothetical protein